MVAASDLVGNLDEVFVVQGFHNIDEQWCMTALDGSVELTNVTQSDDLVELDVVGESVEQLGLGLPLSHLVDVVTVRTQQQQTLLVGQQVKDFQHARRGHQRTVEAVDNVAELIINGI